MVSWDAALGAMNYTASVGTQQGHVVSCSTRDRNCSVSGLLCGQLYSVMVNSLGIQCSSRALSLVLTQTEPCVPQNVSANIDCQTNNVAVSWNGSPGSRNYTALMISPGGDIHTCNTTSTACNITGLSCGTTYNLSVTVCNSQCLGDSSAEVEVTTAPCAPEHVHARTDCATNAVVLSWIQNNGTYSFTSILTSPTGNMTCISDWTNCTFYNLPCGHEFMASVWAANSLCSGPMSMSVKAQTAPCIPMSVNTALDCISNSALISWSNSQGTINYLPLLIGEKGERYNCSSQNTSCWVTNVPCGGEYTVAMTAQNDICNVGNNITVLQTCPCTPQNVSIFSPCNSNEVKVQWMAAPGAIRYKTNVIASNGTNYVCNTTNTTCDIGGLQCGETYNVTVTVFNNQQANVSLQQRTFNTGPCIPTNLRAELPCGNTTATLLWDPARGAATYSVLVSGPNAWSATCGSSNTTCQISDLQCGQGYRVTLIASNTQCNSLPSTLDFYTAPCVPQNVKPTVVCGSNTTKVTWDQTPGAVNYTATVRGADGKPHSCSTSDTTCDIGDLQCGQTYQVVVTSRGQQCQTESPAVQFHTGPCVPQQVYTASACASDSITVLWSAALGADYYTATLIDQSGRTLTCNTTDLRCNITAIQCGKTYTVTSAAYNDQCSSDNSPSVTIVTAPCVPANLVKSVNCKNGSVSLSWDVAPGATAYTVTARVGRNETSITTANTYYEFDNLQCDMVYDIVLSSKSANCTSNGNNSLQIKTIPCPPQILEAYASCDNNSAFIQWEISRNARSYRVVVDGVTTWTANTTNSIYETPPLQCGQNYTVTVWADDGTCTGPNSTKTTFKTVPCVPQNINSTIMCPDNALRVFWDISHGATSYSAEAVASQGDVVTADVSNNTCLLSPLQCGGLYSLTVLAMHDECKSAESAARQVKSAPCSPMHLTATPVCAINGASAQWDPSAGAVSYTAGFHGPDGSEASCDSSTTSCSVSGLQCGQRYNVTVTAYDGGCRSITTNATTVTIAPCMPTNIQTSIDCSSPERMNVTWTPSRGAESYVVVAKGNDGHTLSCSTTTSMCAIQGVRCGYTYSVSVKAWNAVCSSNASTEVTIETVPCIPGVTDVNIDCLTYQALVSWDENNTYPSYYTAVAVDPFGNELSCGDLYTSCQIPGLACGLEYGFHVYSSTRRCNSLNSAVLKSKTAPCQPRDITTNVQCGNNNALISWSESKGAIYYLTTLSGNGTVSICNTTTTNCSYLSLQCGQTYNVTVLAVNDRCQSVLSTVSTFETAPCQPQGLIVNLDCGSQTASMSWRASDGARSYTVLIEDNGTVTPYTTAGTFFRSNALACGRTYGFSLVAIGGTCNSSKSLTIRQYSAPCLPQNASVSVNCANNSAMLSWDGSRGALGYVATVKHNGDLVYSCDAHNTSCMVPDLLCGASYSFSVLAKDMECNSSYTTPIGFGAVPCPPSEVVTSIYRGTVKPQEVEVAWNGSHCGSDYMATIQGQIGNDSTFVLNSYWTSYMDFYIPVPCSSLYSVTVTARNPAGPSYPSTPIIGYTAPCTPQLKPVEVLGGNLLISWQEASYAVEYRVLTMDNTTVLCTTPGFSCQVPLSSYALQVIAVNSAGQSPPAYLSGVIG
ncbi:receptor-type tyrosine-protein phosphatase beta-like isoform X2 [Dendropsophus ebraccatus]|uniref:receptor-type tyrosine-protein phosphatase beta-like isoform X2 n=1 Tax=Dendropsophus ebraccatus TaxID=150705 RepID=UPI003831E25B